MTKERVSLIVVLLLALLGFYAFDKLFDKHKNLYKNDFLQRREVYERVGLSSPALVRKVSNKGY